MSSWDSGIISCPRGPFSLSCLILENPSAATPTAPPLPRLCAPSPGLPTLTGLQPLELGLAPRRLLWPLLSLHRTGPCVWARRSLDAQHGQAGQSGSDGSLVGMYE